VTRTAPAFHAGARAALAALQIGPFMNESIVREPVVLVPGGATHAFENRGDVRAGALNISAPGDFEDRMPGIAEWFRNRDPRDADC
jgi:hypothetical protein